MFNAYFATERIMRKKPGCVVYAHFSAVNILILIKIFPTTSQTQAIPTLWLTGLSTLNHFNGLQKSRGQKIKLQP